MYSGIYCTAPICFGEKKNLQESSSQKMQSIAGGENYEKQAPVVLLDKGTDPARCSSLHTQTQRHTHTHTTAEGWVGYESLGRCLVGAALAGRESCGQIVYYLSR